MYILAEMPVHSYKYFNSSICAYLLVWNYIVWKIKVNFILKPCMPRIPKANQRWNQEEDSPWKEPWGKGWSWSRPKTKRGGKAKVSLRVFLGQTPQSLRWEPCSSPNSQLEWECFRKTRMGVPGVSLLKLHQGSHLRCGSLSFSTWLSNTQVDYKPRRINIAWISNRNWFLKMRTSIVLNWGFC